MKKPEPWWKSLQMVISLLIGMGAIGSWIIGQFVADARQQATIEKVAEDVKDLEQSDQTQEQEIEQTAVQYQLIQQQLGIVVESLKELKAKR